jgi:hypothetical protein
MATIVNTPGGDTSGSGTGMMVGVVVVLILLFLFFVYGLPAIRQPAAPQVSVPEQIDVNVNGPEGQ